MDCTQLVEYRQGLYECFGCGRDVLMNLSDALISETSARSLAELSLSPYFGRRWPSVYRGLQRGRCDRTALRQHLARFAPLPSGSPCLLGIDASSIYRPDAGVSRDRTAQFVHNLSGSKAPVKAGWSFSALVLLPETPSSWVYLLDNVRIPSDQTATQVAVEQLKAILPLLNERLPEGECARVIGDRYYPKPEFLRALHELPVAGLFRIQGHRVLYGPPPDPTGRPGRPRLDGDRFQGKDASTRRGPEVSFTGTDEKGRPFTVSGWKDLHFKQCREVPLWLFEVVRPHSSNTKRDPRKSGFVSIGPAPQAREVPPIYACRFSQEHGYKFGKGPLLWDKPKIWTPEQFQRWTDLHAATFDEIVLARPLVPDLRLPGEAPQRSASPQQVRRGLARILPELGTPARPCQPRGNPPGRQRGTLVRPAPRFSVIKKSRDRPKSCASNPSQPVRAPAKQTASPPWTPPPWLLDQARRASALV